MYVKYFWRFIGFFALEYELNSVQLLAGGMEPSIQALGGIASNTA